MPPAGDGVRFAIATPADDTAMRRLLRDNPMRGTISLSFEREPDYFRGAGLGGVDDTTILAYDGDRLVCMGRCIVRDCWLNGAVRRVAYLGELRLDATVQGRVDILRGGYRYFHELHRRAHADFTFTSIAADNLRARRLLERGLRGLPRYEFLTEFLTLVIPVPRHPRKPTLALETCPPAQLAEFLATIGHGKNLATAWTGERVAALDRHGLPAHRLCAIREHGAIVACAAIWDQRSFRQTVIRGYAPALALARPAINVASFILGTPRLPGVGSVLAHAFVSPLAFAAGREGLAADIVTGLFPVARGLGLEFLTLGVPAADPVAAAIRARFSCRTYASRLYRVTWPGDPEQPALDNRPILPEVALL